MESVNEPRVVVDETNIPQFFRQTREYIFVDYVEVIPGNEAVGHGRTSANDWYFAYHFPNNPVMPGVFQMEAIQQTAGLIINTIEGKESNQIYFLSAETVKIKRRIGPDSEYVTHVKVIEKRRGIWKFEGDLEVDGKKSCQMIFSLVDANEVNNYSVGAR